MSNDLAVKIGFIGAGRLGKTMAMGWQRAGLDVARVASRSASSAADFVARVPGCSAASIEEVIAHCGIVFITTGDDAIAPVAASAPWRAGMAVAHCSGATEVAALEPARARGAAIGALHPIASFGDPDTALASLAGCTASIEADEPLAAQLEAMARVLGCNTIRLPPGCRGVYHAAGGFASQFVNVLLHEAVKLWRGFGATDEQAIRALLPLLKSTVAAIERSGPIQSLPGPVSRGDLGTVRKHVEHLNKIGAIDPYRDLALRSVDLALAKGSIDVRRGEEIRAALLQPSHQA